MEQLKKSLLNTPALIVLDFLLQSPDIEHSDADIVAKVKGAKRAAVNAALLRLNEMGVVEREYKGKRILSRLDQSVPWIRPMKIVSNLLEITPFVEKIKKFSSKIVLFGSRASGDNRHDSDYDLLIISSEHGKIIQVADKIKISDRFQLLLKTPEEMFGMEEKEPVLVKKIMEGIVLWED